ERNPDLSGAVKAIVTGADRAPLIINLELDDGTHQVKLDSTKLMLVLMHMMREGEVALIPETVTSIKRGDYRLIKQFAEMLEEDQGALLEQNAQQFGGLFNTIECRETWAGVDQNARDRAVSAGGFYSLSSLTSKLPLYCPVWRVPSAPAAERKAVESSV